MFEWDKASQKLFQIEIAKQLVTNRSCLASIPLLFFVVVPVVGAAILVLIITFHQVRGQHFT